MISDTNSSYISRLKYLESSGGTYTTRYSHQLQIFREREREREIFYLTTHSTHFIYGYMASDIWLRTILIVRKETRFRHIGYSYRLTARVLLYAPSHRQDNTYHGLCYTSRGALAGTRNSSMSPPHEGSIRRPIAPRANALPQLCPAPVWKGNDKRLLKNWRPITLLNCDYKFMTSFGYKNSR